jgi:sugar O-acyltransferase (sialic acid O-acetyltransferase NeuD family)
MTKKAILLGYGGSARELATWLPELGYHEIVYLDDVVSNPHVIGTFAQCIEHAADGVFATIGNYKSMPQRLSVLQAIPESRFAQALSPKAAVYAEHIGVGCLVYPFSTICSDARLGDFCLVYHSCTVSHDSVVGRNCIISNGAVVSGGVDIGDDCYIGANSTILEGIVVGKNSIIAAGATVIHDVPDGSIYYAPNKLSVNKYVAA